MSNTGILAGSFVAVPLKDGPRIFGQVEAYEPSGVLISVHRLSGKWKCEDDDELLEQFYVPFHTMDGYLKVEDSCGNCLADKADL